MSSPLSMLRKHKRAPLPGPSGSKGSDAFGRQFTGQGLLDSDSHQAPLMSRASLNKDCPPSDLELMSSMMQRLTQLETKVKSQAQQLEVKEKKINILERKLSQTEPKIDVDDKEDLVKTCHRLQTKVTEMEHFLSDYGLIWVGDGEDSRVTLRREQEGAEQEQTQSTGRATWRPDTSAVAGFQVNFDLVLRNIRQLNLLAGEGESFVQATAVGARLATREPVQLRLYRNGILMFDGPFRSHQEPSTQRCLRDLMDGYFPGELQERFPDGVPFQVHDNRHEEFAVRPPWTEFSGKGLAVGAVKNPVSTVPGRKLTKDQFLNRLPKVVVKGGKVIDIRNAVSATLQGSSNGQTSPVTVIDTPALRAMNERLRTGGSNGHPSTDEDDDDDDVTTLRVKSEDGNQSYILKMYVSETIGHLRQYLDKHRGKGIPGYDIISVFPPQCYSDESQTLPHCGLTSSAALLLRPRRGSSQRAGPSDEANLKNAS